MLVDLKILYLCFCDICGCRLNYKLDVCVGIPYYSDSYLVPETALLIHFVKILIWISLASHHDSYGTLWHSDELLTFPYKGLSSYSLELPNITTFLFFAAYEVLLVFYGQSETVISRGLDLFPRRFTHIGASNIYI